MSNEKTNPEDLRDRLIDGGLREVVGGETPPDLAEQILFAATGEQAEKLSTRAIGAEAMATEQNQAVKKRKLWVGLTLAASLLLVAGLVWPVFQQAQVAEKNIKPFSADDGKLNLNANGTNDKLAMKPKSTKVQLPEYDLVPIDSTIKVEDGGTLLLSGVKRLEEGRNVANQDNEQDKTVKKRLGKREVERDSLMMTVTPRIIVQEVEEQRLGILSEDGIEDLTFNEPKPASGPLEARGLDLPATPVPAQESKAGLQGLINSDDRYAWKQKSKHFYADHMTNRSGPARSNGPVGGRGGESDLYLGYQFHAKVQAKDRYDAKQGVSQSTSGLQAKHREVSRVLREKIDKYQRISGELDGAESPSSTTVLNMLINDVRNKQIELNKAKEKLVELDVARTLKEQHARSKLAIKNAPNDQLNQKLIDNTLQLSMAKKKILKLEKEYGEKVAAIKQRGNLSGELALLEAEIDQLTTAETSLETKLRKVRLEQGQGPDVSGDKYTRIYENPFVEAEGERAVSTFSIDVDTAAYANMRQFLLASGQLPPADAVRIEELVNYFDYDYSAPAGDTPFAAHMEVAGCPWQPAHRLMRVGIKGREIETENRPQSNLVFLIDVSGSMNASAKLPLLVDGMKMLTRELGENDRVAIVVYASSEGLALPSTRGDKQDTILAALEKLRAGGSTAGGAGIELAYKIAKENFVEGGVNRVILATDGDFNVGTTSTAELVRMAETHAQESDVFLTVLGFGRGNLNDAMMEQISGKGNGNYHYVDNQTEARKVLVAEMAGTLVTIAKDVKIQIEFNPSQVAAYRLIGYENRMLKTEDFNDDKKDAGEIGAGHTVTAIYEIVPAGTKLDTPGVDPLKYQPVDPKPEASDADVSDELLTLKLRYKQPDGDTSTKVEFTITDNGQPFAEASDDFKFASAVASFGMLLRNSEHRGTTSYGAVLEIAEDGSGEDRHGYRAEFLSLVRTAKELAGE